VVIPMEFSIPFQFLLLKIHLHALRSLDATETEVVTPEKVQNLIIRYLTGLHVCPEYRNFNYEKCYNRSK
jgi:hypothetical protein